MFSEKALQWLEHAPLTNLKEASQAARALCIWGHDAGVAIAWIMKEKTGDHWEQDNPVRNTARTCTALEECGISCSDSIDWLLDIQSDNGSWNDNVYDTCYSLITLHDQKNHRGVQWLLDNFSEDWMHPGTIALINSALIHQDAKGYKGPIKRNSLWLMARYTDDRLKYIATSCLVAMSLILDGRSETIGQYVEQLLDNLENREWNVSIVALVLITLKMYYMNKISYRSSCYPFSELISPKQQHCKWK